jgi:succinate-semialdehyde dehydrogenase/glutarate-semialdehyde dehydrogenase
MTVETVNPATGQVEYRHELMDRAAIERVLSASQRAFAIWSSRPLAERGGFLRAAAGELRRRRHGIQRVMTAEMGKLRKEALAEIEKCAVACEYYADHAGGYLQDKPVATEASNSYVRYEPLGCVLAVMPWNFPLWQVFRFLAPGLMAGNVAVLKHASNVPRCADAIADVLEAAECRKGCSACCTSTTTRPPRSSATRASPPSP